MTEIVIYSKDICPYCVRAKFLLKRKNQEFTEIMVRDEKTMNEMMEKAGGRKTVPQIFINGKYIGGCDELYELDSKGELDGLLEM